MKEIIKPIVGIALLVCVTGTTSATTVTIELPDLVGQLEPYPNELTAVFDLGTSFLQIHDVQIQASGTFIPGLAHSMITGHSWEVAPEIGLYMEWGVATFLHPLESPFEVEEKFELDLDATWDFLLNGKGQVTAYLGWGGAGGGVRITPGSVEISQASLTVEGIIPEPATVLLLGIGVITIRREYHRGGCKF